MRRLAGGLLLVGLLGGPIDAANKGPEIQMIDDKLSVQAEAVPLGRLLHLLDEATGMTSKVPPALANRNISVQFSGLAFDDAVRKIFEGQRLDYFLIGAQSIVVTAASQSGPPEQAGAPPAPGFVTEQPQFIGESEISMPPPGFQPGAGGAPFQPGFPGNPFNPMQQPQQQQPAVIQTPFGPIPNPRANPAGQQPNENNSLGMPTQQNPLGNPVPFGSPSPFGVNPGTVNPGFGPAASPFGSGVSPGLSPSQGNPLQNQPIR